MRPGEAGHDGLIGLWTEREGDADRYKQYYSEMWDESVDWYMNYVLTAVPRNAEFLRGDMIPEAFEMIETLFPQWFLGIVDDPRHISVEAASVVAEGLEDLIKARQVQNLRAQKFGTRSEGPCRLGFVQGHILPMLTFHQEVGQVQKRARDLGITKDELAFGASKMVTLPTLEFNGPLVRYLDLQRTWKSPAVDYLGRPLWWVVSRMEQLDYIKELDRQYKHFTGVPLYMNLDKLTTISSATPSSGRSGIFGVMRGRRDETAAAGMRRYRSTTSRVSRVDDSQLYGSGMIELRECYGWVPPEVKDYGSESTQWRFQTWVEAGEGGVMILDNPCPTPDHKPPIWDVPVLQVGDEPYGKSPLFWSGSEIERRSEMRNIRLAELYHRVYRRTIIDGSANWNRNSMGSYPGAVWVVNNDTGKRLSDIYFEPPTQPLGNDLWNEDMALRQQNKEAMGAMDAMRGQGLGSRASAYEASVVTQMGSGRARQQALMMAARLEQEVCRRSFEMDKTFLDMPVWVKAGERREVPMQLDPAMLQVDVDIVIDAGEYGPVDDMNFNRVLQAVTTLGSLPQAAGRVDWDEVGKELMRLSKAGNRPGRFLYSDEEYAARSQAAAELELAKAALSGTGFEDAAGASMVAGGQDGGQ